MKVLRARPTLLLIAVSLALAGCHREPASPGEGQAPAIARLLELSGPVLVRHSGHLAPASVGELAAGDVVSTGSAGEARISLASGRTVILSHDTSLELAGQAATPRLSLRSGEVTCTPAPAGSAARVSFLTASGEISLTDADAEIALEAAAGLAQVEVRRGSARLSGPDGKPVEAKAGQRYRLTPQGLAPAYRAR